MREKGGGYEMYKIDRLLYLIILGHNYTSSWTFPILVNNAIDRVIKKIIFTLFARILAVWALQFNKEILKCPIYINWYIYH